MPDLYFQGSSYRKLCKLKGGCFIVTAEWEKEARLALAQVGLVDELRVNLDGYSALLERLRKEAETLEEERDRATWQVVQLQAQLDATSKQASKDRWTWLGLGIGMGILAAGSVAVALAF